MSRVRVRVCSEPRCPEITDDPSGRCETHRLKAWSGTTPRLRGRQKTERNKRVIRRHRGICHVCGRAGATVADHVVPLAEGGRDDESNLAPIHPACHSPKTQRESQRGRTRGGTTSRTA